jgi:hypothetical protein
VATRALTTTAAVLSVVREGSESSGGEKLLTRFATP